MKKRNFKEYMNILRKEFLGDDWVIIAPSRGKRPGHSSIRVKHKLRICPFDKGNENLTPPEVFRIGEGKKDSPGWAVRVVPNKFPILKCHEVIIHSSNHYQDIVQLSDNQVLRIFQAYLSRYKFYAHKTLPFIFNNRGKEAGASLTHPHSQLIAFEKIPPAIEEEIEEASKYFSENKKCIFCAFLKQEQRYKKRIVLETANFSVVAPFASMWPYQLLVLPQKHDFDFGKILESELAELSKIFKQLLSVLADELNNPPYNFWLHSLPVNKVTRKIRSLTKIFHWHWEIVPRIKKLGGVEVGAELMVYDQMTPEGVAKVLRRKLKKVKWLKKHRISSTKF